MKKGAILEGTIDRVDFPAKGIMMTEEGPVIIKNAIPGQKVQVRITKKRKGKVEGMILETLEKSPLETESDCPYFGQCGGCIYRTLSYEKQLKLKEKQVEDLLRSVVDEPHYEGILGSPDECGYRNKMEFSFGDACKDGELELGMHKRGSFYDIVTVDGCRIAHPDFSRILKCVLELARESGETYFHKISHNGYLRHLLVRRSHTSGDLMVDLVTSTAIDPEKEKALEEQLVSRLNALELQGRISGILHTHNDSVADAIINQGTTVLYGSDILHEQLLGLDFELTPFSFFQTNTAGAEVLYSKAREYIGETKDKDIYDLYSGTGTIAQVLAEVAGRVTGVEIVEEAVEAAKRNAERNNLTNCRFIAGDVFKVLDSLPEKPDLIVVDPPREGVVPGALRKILNYDVNRIVYISCKITSLVRDLEAIQEAGYRVERSCCIDMFPATSGIETVVLLTKGSTT